MPKNYWLCQSGKTGYVWYIADKSATKTVNRYAPASHREAFTYLQALILCARNRSLFAEKIHTC